MNKQNVIMILMDELMNYEFIPEQIKNQLPGYNAFKDIGLEFTNIHCNRTVCSPSRASIMSGIINHGIQDNIDQAYQYNFVPRLSPTFNTLGKMFKNDNYDLTAYYGKQHFDSTLTSTVFIDPMINTNSRNYMRKYGYDIYSTFGDNFYCPNQGILSDLYTWELKTSKKSLEYDYIDKCGDKYIGMLPFLKARVIDGKNFYCEYHVTNPHDTQHFHQNFNQVPTGTQLQFDAPFILKQIHETSQIKPFGTISNSNLKENFFENNYSAYKHYYSSLPFLNSYLNDYVISSKLNSIFPFFAGSYNNFEQIFTMSESESDIKSWKNLINNYWGLVIEADNYIYQVYNFLKENNMLHNTTVIITADHGELLSSHGLKQKNFPFKEALNVPLIIVSNKINCELIGKKTDILGTSIDIMPTLYTLLNLDGIYNFVGKSLLEPDGNKYIITKEHTDAFHITNGFMFLFSYFNFLNWYNTQTPEITSRIYNVPTNIFEYQSQFVLNQTYINGTHYKFVRFYNLKELIRYNIKHLIRDVNKKIFNFSQLVDILNSINVDLSKYQSNLSIIESTLNMNNLNSFTFEQIYELFKPKDTIELYLIIIAISTFINNYDINLWIIPGLYDDYGKLVENKNYSFFCYDLTKDPDEVLNLADPLYPERHNNELFNILNEKLNQSIIKYECEKLIYNFDNTNLLYAIECFYKFGNNFDAYSKINFLKLITSFFTNRYDTTYSLDAYKTYIND